ncbi:hypothetical protein BCD_1435 (plasmid) [Borrelia crocidurae DOU]|uniref:PTS system, diacetylchitobiose-specific IIA component n=1 Tax=Borrelia crocidurae DOU TaxID=1293575 RepID=W5SR06_9SPIR|nr:PTS lactose/cellobiose transporter subunit IIA [Borrelia crocidurae]AHH07501.1 hypothetical protein BCD_1435 [Borrelia crocidurae DOU]
MNKKKYSIKELIDDISMPVVAYSGEAKSFLQEALEYAKAGNYNKSKEIIEKSKNSIEKAHDAHRRLIQYLTNNPDITTPFILIHAEDHLMSAMSEFNIFEEFISLYKIINEFIKRKKR